MALQIYSQVDSFGAFVVVSSDITHSRDDGPFRLLFHCVLCHEQGVDNVSASRLMHWGSKHARIY